MKKICSMVLPVFLALLLVLSLVPARSTKAEEETGAIQVFREYSARRGIENCDFDLYAEGVVNNQDGFSYDKASNTMTVANVDFTDECYRVVISDMGDLKIKVVGISGIGVLEINEGTVVTFTGDGKLYLSPEQEFYPDPADKSQGPEEENSGHVFSPGLILYGGSVHITDTPEIVLFEGVNFELHEMLEPEEILDQYLTWDGTISEIPEFSEFDEESDFIPAGEGDSGDEGDSDDESDEGDEAGESGDGDEEEAGEDTYCYYIINEVLKFNSKDLKDIEDALVEDIPDQTYTGKAITPKVTVIDEANDEILKQGRDYSLDYKKNTNAGTAEVIIKGMGQYTGSQTASFTIKAKKATPKLSFSKNALIYNGKVQKPKLTVKVGTTTLKEKTDYTVTWSKGCKEVGTYKASVKLKGNYSGKGSASFTINPKGTTLKKPAPASKAFTAKWKKQTAQTTGYQIRYSTNKNFKSAKTVTVKNNQTTSRKISKLKGKTKYYIQVRTYKTVGKKKYYSAWSKAKTVTTAK